MNLIDKIFGHPEAVRLPPLERFGRYSDRYRPPEQEHILRQAAEAFDKGEHLPAYSHFFRYLRDASQDNVRCWQTAPQWLAFEILQGSRKITGQAQSHKFEAVARIAHAQHLDVGFLRQLLEDNARLQYCRYALTPEQDIAIVFDSLAEDASPYKLYLGLKEMATQADKHDDLLIDAFPDLMPIDSDIRRDLPIEEKIFKYEFLRQAIGATLAETEQGPLQREQYPVAMVYLLLSLCYKLDYLLRPQGYLMEALERIHRLAFEEDSEDPARKCQRLQREFRSLLERPAEKYFGELYEVSSTFGITEPAEHDKVALVIDQELPQMKWYLAQGYDRIALAIPGFIIGSCLFNLAPPLPDRALFHLLMQVLEPAFFQGMGYTPLTSEGLPDKTLVRKVLRQVRSDFESEYPAFRPDPDRLRYDSLPRFTESFLWMVRDLDLQSEG
ncbi:MAG: hypothetical protein RLY31_53 [Bacteroidota bacterium]